MMNTINFIKINKEEVWAVIDDTYFGKPDRWHLLSSDFKEVTKSPLIIELNNFFQQAEARTIFELAEKAKLL